MLIVAAAILGAQVSQNVSYVSLSESTHLKLCTGTCIYTAAFSY